MNENRKPVYAALVGGRSVNQDNIFVEHPSQDGRTAMYRLLQLELQRHQIILHTPDVLKSMGVRAQIEIHINARKSVTNAVKKYVLLIEAPILDPLMKIGLWSVNIEKFLRGVKTGYPISLTPSELLVIQFH